MSERVEIWVDGGSRGNPGPSAAGALLEWPSGQSMLRSWFLGERTNNEAEYLAVIYGLQTAGYYGAQDVMVYTDSQLVAKQLNGYWDAKNPRMEMLMAEAFRIALRFDDFQIEAIARDRNSVADGLVNERLDSLLE